GKATVARHSQNARLTGSQFSYGDDSDDQRRDCGRNLHCSSQRLLPVTLVRVIKCSDRDRRSRRELRLALPKMTSEALDRTGRIYRDDAALVCLERVSTCRVDIVTSHPTGIERNRYLPFNSSTYKDHASVCIDLKLVAIHERNVL